MNVTNFTDCIIVKTIRNAYPHTQFFVSAILTMSPVIVISNVLLIVAMVATKQATQNTSNLLIMCLSVSDLISGVISLPLLAYILLSTDNKIGCTLPNALAIMGGCFGNFSPIVTVLMAVDRYLHMNPNIQHKPSALKTIFKLPNTIYLVAIVLISTLSFSSIVVLIATNDQIMAALHLSSVCGTTIYFLSITCLYVKGYKRISSFADNNIVYSDTVDQPQYVKSLYKTVFVFVILICVTYLPYSLTNGVTAMLIILKVSYAENTALIYFAGITQLIVYSSGFTNCLVVFHYNKKVKRWIFRKVRIRTNNSEGS